MRASPLMTPLLYRFADPDGVRAIQQRYVRFFTDVSAETVLDLGCGRGIFLALLREAGIEPHGVDGSSDSVDRCHAAGFERVICGEVLQTLDELATQERTFGGVFCSHLVEHLDGGDAVSLVELCARVLRPGGRLVLVTPNPANLKVLSKTFWLDPTHKRPYPRPLLEAMFAEAGLTVARSFDDPKTGNRYLGAEFFSLFPDLFRYGFNTFLGFDSLVAGDRPS